MHVLQSSRRNYKRLKRRANDFALEILSSDVSLTIALIDSYALPASLMFARILRMARIVLNYFSSTRLTKVVEWVGSQRDGLGFSPDSPNRQVARLSGSGLRDLPRS